MSTQHPDNASAPFFASSAVLAGEDEIREAYYAFSHLGCDEQMWDAEGKELDTHVVKKLLSRHPQFFADNTIGEDVRITLRVPNPTVETAEAKVLLETLESVPRSYDTARLFYGRDVAPIFEVILPMTTSASEIERLYRYYADHIIGRQYARFADGGITIAEWIGPFRPDRIQVIPLFEDVPTMLRAADIVEEYVAGKDIQDQRVFLARSDTAMNSGLVSAALANKIALARLDELSARTGVRIHPILGMGSAPFRGGLTPRTAPRVGAEYPSVVTFSIQSAFKYDYPADEARAACEYLKGRSIGRARHIDPVRAQDIIDRYSRAYRRRIVALAPDINRMARHVPARRARRLHVGLFGYARQLDGITLPRAIAFTCALYSLGLPPELIGLEALDRSDFAFVLDVYPSVRAKLQDALRQCDCDGPLMTPETRSALVRLGLECEADEDHLEVVRDIRDRLTRGEGDHIGDLVQQAAILRRFLG